MFYSKWVELPLVTRVRLAEHFGVTKSGPTHVVDNKIQSDGYLLQDIERVLVEISKAFPNLEFDDAIDAFINMLDNPVVVSKEIKITNEMIEPGEVTVLKKPRGRPKKIK